MKEFFLTFFYLGYVKRAPGTFASLVALIPAFLILRYLGITTLLLLSIFIFIVSIKIIDEYEMLRGVHDPKHIVIDELAGLFLACAIAASTFNSLFNLFMAFILFRIFDITKPSIIGKIDKKIKGGLGVMLDDMLAGFFAGFLSTIIYGFLMQVNLIFWDKNLRDLF